MHSHNELFIQADEEVFTGTKDVVLMKGLLTSAISRRLKNYLETKQQVNREETFPILMMEFARYLEQEAKLLQQKLNR